MTEKIFIAGGSGCVGHYLVESLLAQTDWHLYLLLRHPHKLQVPIPPDRGTILQGSLQDIQQYQTLIGEMHYLVSTVACWGGQDTYLINVDKTHELFSYLNGSVCKRAVYFSTASIIDRHLQILPQALTIGTDYIRSKAMGLLKMQDLPLKDKVITVFPTIVFGGNGYDKPFAFTSAGIKDIVPYLPLIKFLKAEGSFHFIHGFDIAQMVTHILQNGYPDRQVVLGMAPISVNQALQEICALRNQSSPWQIDVNPTFIKFMRWLFRIQMAEWDEFCLSQRHFTYPHLCPADLGLTARYPRLAQIVQDALPP
jgi:nucleoside-diphosphate-sugar epimerase